ncbi:MAG: lactonase family protein [Kiritimatiellia bacterium]
MKLCLFIGTYTSRGSAGIYRAWFEPHSEWVELEGLAAREGNPSFLALGPSGDLLYAVCDLDAENPGQGAVSAYRITGPTGELKFLNRASMHGPRGCHLTVDRTGSIVLVANYTEGSVSAFPVGNDGSLGERSDFHQYHGRGPNSRRQEKPHAHSVSISPDNRIAVVADLGTDRLMLYQLDTVGKRLLPHAPQFVSVQPGAGPRHFAFHPNGRWAYLINELDSTLTVFAYDAPAGLLRTLQTESALPADFAGENIAADVHVSPSGRFVYCSNRGHDSIAVFAVDSETGRVSVVGHTETRGRTPRNFVLTPDGDYLLAANQATGNVVVFRVDSRSGSLAPAGGEIRISMPVCLLFAEVPS